MTDRAQDLYDYINSHKSEFISVLEALVKEETPSDKPDLFSGLFSILEEEFSNLDLSVERISGEKTAGQMLARPDDYDSQNASQLIIGHCDTVWDTGSLEDMPFSVKHNHVLGPGVFDMKAGLTMMIFAMRAIKAADKKPAVQPVFLINSDEEIGSNESKELIIEQAKMAERTYVLEPALGTEGKIKTRRKGIGEFEIQIKGKPSHAGLAPEEGVSAILGLSHIVQELFKLNEPSRGITVNVGTIEGGERSNVVAAKSKAVVDVRVPSKEAGKQIEKQIYGLKSGMEGIEVEISGGINRPPLEKTEENIKLWDITQNLADELDITLEEGISGGASDGNFTNLYSATIDGLGAVGEGAHAYHEKIYLDKTIERTALLSLLLLEPRLMEK